MTKQLKMMVGVALFATLALAGTLGAFALSAAQPAHAQGSPTGISRSISPMQVATGGTVEVAITNNMGGIGLATVTETLPSGWTYQSIDPSDVDVTQGTGTISFEIINGETITYTVMAPSTDGCGSFSGTYGDAGAMIGGDMDVTVGAGCGNGGGQMPVTGDVGTVEASSSTPGSGAEYVVKFTITGGDDLTAGDWIEFQFTDDLSVPDSIAANTISIKGTGDNGNVVAAPPASVAVDGGDDDPWEVRMRLGDMSDADGLQGLIVDREVTVIIEKAAGIKNSTKGGLEPDDIGWQVLTSADDNGGENYDITGFNIYRKVSVSSEEEPRGEEILATAKGFEKNTTVTFVSMPKGTNNRTNVCSATANSDGIAECSFRLLKSLFGSGTVITLTAQDGDGNAAHYDKGTKDIALDKSMSVSPQAANVGDTINIRLVDFGVSATSSSDITISFRGMMVCEGNCDVQGLTDNNGEIQFDYMIPPDVRPGSQTLAVKVGTGDDAVSDDVTIGVGSGSLSVTATEVLANQRISLSASGFTRPASGQECAGASNDDETVYIRNGYGYSSVTLGGEQIDWGRINDGDAIEVTSGGGWSAPIDLPIDDITTDPGTYELKIVDCHGGQATVDLTFPDRVVTMSPEMGRVGSEVVITGSNFPVANDEYGDVDVNVSYTSGEEEDSDRTETDAVGSFTIIMEVPEDAGIPSNNTVRVSFNKDVGTVDQSFTHRVPQGSISFSASSGAEGSLLMITAEGFARYTSVDEILFGDREITPLPRPSTGRTGDVEFDVRIPGADPGIYIIKVVVDDVTATQIFTVVSGSGVVDGSVDSILANVMSEDALDRVFKFNNETKEWQWYINDPAFASTNNLAGLSSGDLVWIKVSKSVTADILGTSTTLTCINEGMENEDCWNQISIP